MVLWCQLESTILLSILTAASPEQSPFLIQQSSIFNIMDPTPVSLHDLFAFGTPKSCIAHTKDSRRCGNHSSQKNLESAKEIWDAIAAGANDAYVNKKMDDLASHCLCKNQHQGQTAKIAEIWKTQYHFLRRYHQAGFQVGSSRNTATGTTLADQIKTDMFSELYRHKQEYDDITRSFARKQSQPDVEMIDAL